MGLPRVVSTFDLGWRCPTPTQAMMAPLICWSFNNSMFKDLLVEQAVAAMSRGRAAARSWERLDCREFSLSPVNSSVARAASPHGAL